MIRFSSAVKSAGFAAIAMAALLPSSANAAPITFTWDPFGGGISSPGSQFTANNITIADYAIINIPVNPTLPGSITESGILAMTSFDLQAPSVSTPGFVNGTGSGVGIPGASPYQLYLQFTSTSHLNPTVPGSFQGSFDSVSYTLWGDGGGNCDFTPAGVSGCGADTLVALATGSLAAPSTPFGTLENSVSIINGNPAAQVLLSFTQLVPGFFIDPPAFVAMQMEGSFTNTPGVVTRSPANCPESGLPCQITINGGGGNLNFLAVPVPEPGSLALLGTGLVAWGWAARRRRARS